MNEQDLTYREVNILYPVALKVFADSWIVAYRNKSELEMDQLTTMLNCMKVEMAHEPDSHGSFFTFSIEDDGVLYATPAPHDDLEIFRWTGTEWENTGEQRGPEHPSFQESEREGKVTRTEVAALYPGAMQQFVEFAKTVTLTSKLDTLQLLSYAKHEEKGDASYTQYFEYNVEPDGSLAIVTSFGLKNYKFVYADGQWTYHGQARYPFWEGLENEEGDLDFDVIDALFPGSMDAFADFLGEIPYVGSELKLDFGVNRSAGGWDCSYQFGIRGNAFVAIPREGEQYDIPTAEYDKVQKVWKKVKLAKNEGVEFNDFNDLTWEEVDILYPGALDAWAKTVTKYYSINNITADVRDSMHYRNRQGKPKDYTYPDYYYLFWSDENDRLVLANKEADMMEQFVWDGSSWSELKEGGA